MDMRDDASYMKMVELKSRLCKAFEFKAREIRKDQCEHASHLS